MRGQGDEEYLNLTLRIMEKEFNLYENEFNNILEEVGISKDMWDLSNDIYLNNDGRE